MNHIILVKLSLLQYLPKVLINLRHFYCTVSLQNYKSRGWLAKTYLNDPRSAENRFRNSKARSKSTRKL